MNKHSVSDISIQMKIQIRKISIFFYAFEKRITVTSAASGTRMKMFCNNQLCWLMVYQIWRVLSSYVSGMSTNDVTMY